MRVVHAAHRAQARERGQGIDDVTGGPPASLLEHVQVRLDQPGIRHQACQRPQVRQRVEPVGRAIRIAIGIPALQQRTGAGQEHEGQADRASQQQEDLRDGRRVRMRLPAIARRDRGRPGRRTPREQHQDDRDERAVAQRLCAARQRGDRVGIGVAGQEQHLEDHEAGRPHRRRSAEPRQDQLGEQELDLEEQAGAEPDGQAERSRTVHACGGPGVAMSSGNRAGVPSITSVRLVAGRAIFCVSNARLTRRRNSRPTTHCLLGTDFRRTLTSAAVSLKRSTPRTSSGPSMNGEKAGSCSSSSATSVSTRATRSVSSLTLTLIDVT